MTTTATAQDSLIRLPEVLKRTGLSRASVYRLMDAGDFPAKRKLMGTARSSPICFSANEVQAWINKRMNPANDGEEQ
ncbi:helix-turn-helix transcriptional regulator [Ectopseudomonas oleovorans]|uniref:AlpA family phage regulatory protein n=1 Tax=Ectopseudomonas oleovorans TaxID=301 RepID=A0AA42QE38_ECTOL|nr:AlpA family phage regulatory protein [Pseudomonas oleovorans]MDH1341875.1 AlpA family phage regulatory protein [Pseudomonas oleovorans]MDH1490871.1 AlpA family phage regulatory protein [Pseudomonas oleovorans]WGG19626.1 AlpA family phage regulatory protein [Pseudomonas oleovorans]